METKFTKGEWTIDYGHTLGHIKAVMGGKQNTPTVAIYNNRSRLLQQQPSEEELANAKLIAAAPDLFNAIMQIVDRIENNWDLITSGTQNGIKTVLISEAKAAIKKATE